MGNIASYFSDKGSLEEYIGQIDEEKPIDGSHQTPARCATQTSQANQFFDPRSPTLNFDRTPIVFEEEIESERPEDPRSPSFGITRTPVAPALESETKALIQKEREDLIQVLNFTDLDCLSLSNIEEDASLITEEVPEEVPEGVPAPSAEETFDFSSLVIPASSTPAPSPVKQPTSNKTKRPVTNNVVDENSFGKNNSPLSSPNPQKNAPSVRPRVPFGDVNRPALASPRLHLQNKQRHLVRSELLQHQQRYGNKSD